MTTPYDLSLSLLPTQPRSAPEALADRVRLVLDTRPGWLPYAPEFGCDLDGLVGGNATEMRLTEAKLRIQTALARWIPDAPVARCEVRMSELKGATSADPLVPVAEHAMTSAGVAATLDVHLVLQTPEGPVALEAQMNP